MFARSKACSQGGPRGRPCVAVPEIGATFFPSGFEGLEPALREPFVDEKIVWMSGGPSTYLVHGLRLSSEIDCPELAKAQEPSEPDVRIRVGEVPQELPEPTVRGVAFQATTDRFLLDVVSASRYLATAGSEVVVEPHPHADAASVCLFLLESVMSATLHQRGLLPLCGSAIESQRGAMVFIGPPGLGKSTLAALFCLRGYRPLSDGICCLATSDRQTLLHPSQPGLSLWRDTLERLNIPKEGLEPVRPGPRQRYRYFPNREYRPEPVPVRAIYVLGIQNATPPGLTPLGGLDAARALSDNTCLPRLLRAIGSHGARHFRQVCQVARRVRISRIMRRDSVWELDQLAGLLETDLAI